MDDISLALNPPRSVKIRRPAIPISNSPCCVWPLAAINGRAPVVLEHRRDARGVALAYPRVDTTDAIENCPIGTPFGTATHFKFLHFELWERDRDRIFVPVDPRPHFASWTLRQHHDAFTPAPPIARSEAA